MNNIKKFNKIGLVILFIAIAFFLKAEKTYAYTGPTNYTYCADENGTCTVSGTKTVAYGENGAYNYLQVTTSTACTNAVFGDPAPGVVKHCFWGTQAPTASGATGITAYAFTANWGAISGATSYNLDVSTASNFSSFVSGYNNLSVASTSQNVILLTASTTYYYRVSAVAATGTSAESTTINLTTSSPGSIWATGGSITQYNGYTIHNFTTSGTFTPSGSGNVEILVVAGGGGGGGPSTGGGGGGAGGIVYDSVYAVTAQAYTVTVGGGGAINANGSNSVFSTITAVGGGAGGAGSGQNGGSGGGVYAGGTPGSGTQTASGGEIGYGHNGGTGNTNGSGGGGGAGAVGQSQSTNLLGGNGGDGIASSISGASVTYGGGGGGGGYNTGGNGGSGGGGIGSNASSVPSDSTHNGTANTGGGGGGSVWGGAGTGGSGIVIIRYLTPVDCASLTSGNYTLPSSCTFPTVQAGVDAGTGTTNTAVLTIPAGMTLTIGNIDNQVITYGSIILQGQIIINKNHNASLRKAGLWVADADGDGYPDSANPTYSVYANGQSPAGYKRRAFETTLVTADCSPSNASLYQNLTGYADADGDTYTTATTAQVCSGASFPAYNISTNPYRSAATAADCLDTVAGGGANVFQNVANLATDADQDGYYTGAGSIQCVGGTSSINGYSHYKNSSGVYSLLATTSSAGGSDCDDANPGPCAATNASASVASSSQLNLSWTAATQGPTSYDIYYCTGTSCSPTTLLTNTASTSYSHTSLTASTVYGYKIIAKNSLGSAPATSNFYGTTSSSAMVVTLLTSGFSNSTGTSSYTTASIAPGANHLIVAVFTGNHVFGSPTVTQVTGALSSWTSLNHAGFNTFSNDVAVYRGLSASPGTGTVTVTWSTTMNGCAWAIYDISNVDTSGTNGSGAIVQSNTASGSSTAPSVTLSAFSNINNAAFGAIAWGTTSTRSVTPGAGFTELNEVQTGAWDGVESEYQLANDTTVNGTLSSSGAWGIVGFEVKKAP